jgi:hypothetical protein
LLLLIRNDIGQIIFSKLYPHTTSFKGILNLSALGDGNYTLQVSTLMKAGFVKHSFKQSFQIQTRRSISPMEPASHKELITLEAN